ncbi:MAG TPA: endonuclease MutS2 [Chloroflexus aurantiacus]|uniref:Endonuclease MutS2 n=4 Tax=Chloroflexaceae TaxID=1106 RepID=A9WJD6_CHLAA|nr:MutS2 family protein [Chloroflexus aurantiacus J-10-fl]RMG46186.1 MAG: endonuclease MutS2 [Chloroflexota bacterium]HBW68048.1 endonuclease MutS2 [Chloroflexus aurantiacus]
MSAGMSIPESSLITLEFDVIRDRLAQYTAFSASRELALSLTPATDLAEVRRRQALTAEARLLLEEWPEVSIGGARDVRRAVQHAARGGILDGTTLREIAATLQSAALLRQRLSRLDERFPLLIDLANTLPVIPSLSEAIDRAIGDDGQVLDSASPTLARLRHEVRVAFNRLQERLQSMIHSSALAGALQEPIITVRNGRYVIPVKASHRREVRGLVHDQSGSGATLYIEPMAIVELNNRWRELQSAEAEEVQRILSTLSDQVGAAANLITSTVNTLATLDLAFALARYAIATRSTAPEIVDWRPDDPPSPEPPLRLTRARHPLLPAETVVPIDLWLGGEFSLLLITGPNTGGKTVALKTTGLLALMAQAGMQIPADQPSRLPVFQYIFADIGDEQSIEQSLSTFSSHMANIIRVLQTLTAAQQMPSESDAYALFDDRRPAALVLFDELGAGTDPVEGAALARAIIGRLLELGVLGIATTHYAELKAFAYTTPGVQNASVEFDIETLAPTYRLSIGIPGRSNALAIAARLGLDPTLIEQARSFIDRKEAQVEDLLAGIQRERDAAAAALQRAEELRLDAERYRDRLAAEQQAFAAERAAALEAARAEIEAELREVRQQLRRLREEFRTVNISRQWLEEAEKRLATTAEQSQQAVARLNVQTQPAPPPPAEKPLQVGDQVQVTSIGLNGEIVAIDEEDQTATVQVGGFRMTVSFNDLKRAKGKSDDGQRFTPPARTVHLPPTPDVSMTFDMRGWRAAEVSDRLDRYLNDAYLAGLHQVRLIHGKGTGALRQVVRELLAGHPLVASFSSGGRDGGDGVTIATLVDR